jgi:ATP-dependent RNA helicase RhlE
MTTTLFTDLPLGRELQQALREAEHVTPTPIQAAAIPVVLEGRDLLGCAQTGTGKTAAFALPLLEQFRRDKPHPAPRAPLALILVPTRELAAQVMESIRRYGKHLRIWQTAVYGGVNQNPQVSALRRGVHVLVATPGRLIDLMQQGHVKLDQVRTLILDEADRMLDMGFLPPLKQIIAKLPEQRQSLCFSATMPREIADLVQKLLKNPHRIDIAPPATTTALVEQRVLKVDQTGKRDALQNILKTEAAHRVLVFTRTKRRADVVTRHLQQADIEADAIHGDKSQNARTRALDRFKSGKTHVLVATDVAARGIDVSGISHVINYDMPHDPESYVHRIGRTGRASEVGVAITFYDASERQQLRAIERLIGVELLPKEERQSRPPRREGENGAPSSSGGQHRPQGQHSQGQRPDGARRPGKPKFKFGKKPAARREESRPPITRGSRTPSGSGESSGRTVQSATSGRPAQPAASGRPPQSSETSRPPRRRRPHHHTGAERASR